MNILRKILNKVGGNWLFLIIVVFAYFIVALIDIELYKKSIAVFLNLFWTILPILGLVFGLIFISNLVMESKFIIKYLGQGAGAKGWLIAITGGILSHGPIYMWYPLLADLKEKGVKISYITAFLYNRAVKIPLIPLMIFYFSLPFVVVLSSYMIIFSIINGVAVEKIINHNV